MAQTKRNLWQIEDVDEDTRRKIKGYAALKGVTIAEALKRIVAQSDANK